MIHDLGSVQRLFDSIATHTLNAEEVTRRVAALLEHERPLLCRRHLVYAMRNIGKAEGEDHEVGEATEPMRDLGYPGT